MCPVGAAAAGYGAQAGGQGANCCCRHQLGLPVCDDAGRADAAGGGGLCVMAIGAGRGAGGGGAASWRHDEGLGVILKMTLKVPS